MTVAPVSDDVAALAGMPALRRVTIAGATGDPTRFGASPIAVRAAVEIDPGSAR